jgi:DNA-binding response OmpR family regulator
MFATASMPMTSLPLILIADDEPLLTELLDFRLAARGYRTAIAHDGREALAMLDELHPDAVVLDMMMPVHDGSEVLRRMRASESHASTPVIMLTARRGEADVVGALELGADDYLVKPFLPEELLIRLSRLLAGRRA